MKYSKFQEIKKKAFKKLPSSHIQTVQIEEKICFFQTHIEVISAPSVRVTMVTNGCL